MEDFIDEVANAKWQSKKEELKKISLEIMGEEEAEEFNRVLNNIPPVAWIGESIVKLSPLQENFLHTFNMQIDMDGTEKYFIPYIFEKVKKNDKPGLYRLLHINKVEKEFLKDN